VEVKKYELQENRWSLFRNKLTDNTKENAPEFSGSININGTLYKLNGWVNEYSGGKYFSGTVRLETQDEKGIPI
jgi:hypothetical protein